MADKKLTLSATVDLNMEAFKNQVKQMQAELAKISGPTAQMQQQQKVAATAGAFGGGPLAGPSAEAYKKASDTARQQLVQRIQDESKANQLANKGYDERIKSLERLQAIQKRVVGDASAELAIKEKILATERDIQAFRQKAAVSASNVDQIARAMDKTGSGLTSQSAALPSNGNAPAAGNSTESLLAKLGGAAAIAGVVNKVISAGIATYRGYGEAPLNASVNQGSAMSGTFGSELRGVYSGRSGIESAYLPEKLRASSIAQANLENQKRTDTASIYGIIGGAGLAGAAGGSLFGPAGTVIGGAAGILGGTGGALMNPRMRARMLGEGSEKFKTEYESMNAKDFANNYQSDLEAEKQKDPLKYMALEDYQSRQAKNLEFQRASGLNYSSFHGKDGFREQAINAGFTDDLAMGMGGNILASGGSTRAAQSSSMLGLQVQRGFGLNNAGSLLGTLSGGMGSSGATSEATIKLLSEGMRLGLDSSQFREENRKFSESAAEVISRSGVTSGAGTDSVLDQFGGFFGDKTNKGMEAGKTAYDTYQNLTSSTSGPNGVMRLAGMIKDNKLSGLSGTDRGALMQLPAEQMNPDNPTVQDIASRNGMESSDLISRMGKVNQGSIHRFARADELQKSLTSNYVMSPESRDKMFGEYRTLSGLENPNIAKDPRALTEFAQGSLSIGAKNRDAFSGAVTDKLNNKDTGISEDRAVQQSAEASRLMLENFQKLGPTIGASAESIKKFNDELAHTVEIISKMPENERNGFFSKMFPSILPGNQAQGGKTSK